MSEKIIPACERALPGCNANLAVFMSRGALVGPSDTPSTINMGSNEIVYIYETKDGQILRDDCLGPRDLTNVRDMVPGEDHPSVIVQGYVQDYPVAMTVDTSGASVTCMHQKVYYEIPPNCRPQLQPTTMCTKVADGRDNRPIGVALCLLRLADVNFLCNLPVYVFSDMHSQLLLGKDFVKQVGWVRHDEETHKVGTKYGETPMKLMYPNVPLSGILQQSPARTGMRCALM